MVRWGGLLLLGLAGSLAPAVSRVADGPNYTADGQLRYPEKYREWVFLTSGLDMSYNPKATAGMGAGTFDNVFVNPEAYRSYQATGHWPQGTMLVLENRGAETGKSINQAGKTQARELTGTEVHVLDSAHADHLSPNGKSDGWTFYGFENKVSAKAIPRTADCYACHERHAAVDTTFVQFYPTLQEAAEQHGTFSSAYLRSIRATQ